MSKEYRKYENHRGVIIRNLAIFYPSGVDKVQLLAGLSVYEISEQEFNKHIAYIMDKELIKVNLQTGIFSLTAKGIDLVEGRIHEKGIIL